MSPLLDGERILKKHLAIKLSDCCLGNAEATTGAEYPGQEKFWVPVFLIN